MKINPSLLLLALLPAATLAQETESAAEPFEPLTSTETKEKAECDR